MPLTVKIPAKDLYDPKSNRFISVKDTTITFEHSLISISKWEAKWHKPYLSKEQKTPEEQFDYLRCMCLTRNVDPNAFYALDSASVKSIADYIADPMTATTFRHQDKRGGSEILTNEVIYFYMANFQIPFDPCEKWHLNRLLTLIEVASIKNQPPKKMGKRDMLNQRAALNAQRRAKFNTRG